MAKKEPVTVPGDARVAVGGGLRYVGDGSYLPGVPARDLTAEEAAEHAARYGQSPAWTTLYAPVDSDVIPVGDPAGQEE